MGSNSVVAEYNNNLVNPYSGELIKLSVTLRVGDIARITLIRALVEVSHSITGAGSLQQRGGNEARLLSPPSPALPSAPVQRSSGEV